MKVLIASAALLLVAGGFAGAAEPVVGTWRTESGETARIAPCGGAFCITLLSGPAKGRQIGRMSGTSGSYQGEITDPAAERTYAGTAEVSGRALRLTGCALRVFCRSQTWSKL